MLPYKFLRLPHKRQIGGGLRENAIIRLRGRTFENPKEFTIRLTCGEDDGDDAPLVFTKDMRKNTISVNTEKSNAWLRDAETLFRTDYFQPATDFDFAIECSEDSFLMKLGGLEHSYKHKLPFHTIRYLIVDGDVNLQDVAIIGVSDREEQCRIPIARELPERVEATRIVVRGIPVRAKPHRMAIDFTSGVQGNLEFHFNPRFNHEVLVRNTMIGNRWGEEEKNLLTGFPFAYGVAFELDFTLQQNFIYVRLNGNHLCKYERRDSPRRRIIKMCVYGSVVITEAEMQ